MAAAAHFLQCSARGTMMTVDETQNAGTWPCYGGRGIIEWKSLVRKLQGNLPKTI
jgi:hypothetical protein